MRRREEQCHSRMSVMFGGTACWERPVSGKVIVRLKGKVRTNAKTPSIRYWVTDDLLL